MQIRSAPCAHCIRRHELHRPSAQPCYLVRSARTSAAKDAISQQYTVLDSLHKRHLWTSYGKIVRIQPRTAWWPWESQPIELHSICTPCMHVRICKSGVFERLCLPPIAAATVCALSDHLTPPQPMAQARHITPATSSDGATSFSRSSTAAEVVTSHRPPFARCDQLCSDLEYLQEPEKPCCLRSIGPGRTLPDAPRVQLDDPCQVLAYCLNDLDTPRLNHMGEKLW